MLPIDNSIFLCQHNQLKYDPLLVMEKNNQENSG